MGHCLFLRKGGEWAEPTPSNKHIYGVEWDGTSTTKLTRTDDAVDFVDPNPAVANGTGSSPFDNLMPWSGMTQHYFNDSGVLVSIPKFWYKITKDGLKLKIQIADYPADGFFVSPAHIDRADGRGERDIVYVGRYHCRSDDYKSLSGSNPSSTVRPVNKDQARNYIHRLGDNVWQYDIIMRQTIQMLYIVEFANWNSQETIGYGCSSSGQATIMGITDEMKYHTGTNATNRATYGHTQYRNIEGLWDNVLDYLDGCWNNYGNLMVKINPSEYNTMNNAKVVATLNSQSGYISSLGVTEVDNILWLYSVAENGSDSTYIPDMWSNNIGSRWYLAGGGYYQQNQIFGMFYLSIMDETEGSVWCGCRLQKLP